MQELRLSIKRMLDKLFPWHRGLLTAISDDYVTTSQLIETIDALVYEDVTGKNQTQVSLCNFLYFLCSSLIIVFIITALSHCWRMHFSGNLPDMSIIIAIKPAWCCQYYRRTYLHPTHHFSVYFPWFIHHLGFLKVLLTASTIQSSICINMPYLMEISRTIAEIYSDFTVFNMADIRHLGFVMCVFGPLMKSISWSLSLCKTSLEPMQ